ncbi:MAG: oligosaccharide flippase family protein [Planctomycetaceae bacterium]|nr:oligosaccharide flippase family protein [Planctomycetaceae bacterium]
MQPTGTEFIQDTHERLAAAVTTVRRLLVSESLKARCAKGSISLTAGTVVSKVVALVSKIVLAKLLAAEELGLMIVILPLVTFFDTLTEIGIKQAVIQHKEGATERYLNTAWWIQSIRGVLLYCCAYLLSPILCRIWVYGKADVSLGYSQSELLWMVRIAFLTILFNGFISPRSNVLLKEFKFGRSVILAQGSTILGSVLTIILAVAFRNVWAFVIGTVSQYFFLCVLSYVMCPFMPRRTYHAASFHALMRFGRGMFGLPLLTYLAFYMDVLVGSLFISRPLIGMYGFALILARTPRELLTRIFGPLLIPAYAEKQDDPRAISRGVLWITWATSLVVLPLTVYMIVCRNAILTILYKPEFTQVGLAFSLLCLTYTILLQEFPLGKVFLGIGTPEKHRLYVILRALLLAGLIVPAIKLYGITGLAGALLLSNAAAYWYQLRMLHKLIGLDIRAYWSAWIPGLAVSAVYLVVLAAVFVIWPENLNYQFWVGGAALGLTIAAVLGMSLLKTHRLLWPQYS